MVCSCTAISNMPYVFVMAESAESHETNVNIPGLSTDFYL